MGTGKARSGHVLHRYHHFGQRRHRHCWPHRLRPCRRTTSIAGMTKCDVGRQQPLSNGSRSRAWPRAAAPPSTPPLANSQSQGGSSLALRGSSIGPSASPNLPKDTPSTSANGTTAPKGKPFANEIASRTSQRVTALPPQARPNAGASWSNEPEPPIQSERPMPDFVGGPMRANPSHCVAPHSLAGEASARTPDAGEP